MIAGACLRQVNGFFVAYVDAFLRRDAWHVSFALACGGVFGQPDALSVRARRTHRQSHRSSEMAFCARRPVGHRTGFPSCPSHFWVMVGWPSSWVCVQLQSLGPPSLCDWRPNRLPGSPVFRSIGSKFQAYVFSSFTASLASLLLLGYNGSAINAMGQGMSCRVIAATVIGGANLMGGAGTAFGAFIGSAFLEVIRNALLMAGIDSNWQGAFVGAFIVLAVLLGCQTGGKSIIAAALEQLFPKSTVETEFTAGNQ